MLIFSISISLDTKLDRLYSYSPRLHSHLRRTSERIWFGAHAMLLASLSSPERLLCRLDQDNCLAGILCANFGPSWWIWSAPSLTHGIFAQVSCARDIMDPCTRVVIHFLLRKEIDSWGSGSHEDEKSVPSFICAMLCRRVKGLTVIWYARKSWCAIKIYVAYWSNILHTLDALIAIMKSVLLGPSPPNMISQESFSLQNSFQNK